MSKAQHTPSDKDIMTAVTPESTAVSGLKRDSQALTNYRPQWMAPSLSSYIKGKGHKNNAKYYNRGEIFAFICRLVL